MKYEGSIKNIKLYKKSFFFERYNMKRRLNKLIKLAEENVDFLRKYIKGFDEQKKKWEQDKDGSYSDEIATYSQIIKVFELVGRQTTICLDVYTALKYLIYFNSEYECRFFARRILTIIYETRKGYIADLGNLLGEIKELPYIKHYDSYKEIHKHLNRFYNEYVDFTKKVRNTNEAHKSEDFETQVESIELLNIEKAWDIIIVYYHFLTNSSIPNMHLLQELSNHANKDLWDKMERANERLRNSNRDLRNMWSVNDTQETLNRVY